MPFRNYLPPHTLRFRAYNHRKLLCETSRRFHLGWTRSKDSPSIRISMFRLVPGSQGCATIPLIQTLTQRICTQELPACSANLLFRCDAGDAEHPQIQRRTRCARSCDDGISGGHSESDWSASGTSDRLCVASATNLRIWWVRAYRCAHDMLHCPCSVRTRALEIWNRRILRLEPQR